MIACATQSVTTSASVTLRLAFSRPLRQEIVRRDINSGKQQVEVGVHRGPLCGRRCFRAPPTSTLLPQKPSENHDPPNRRGINHLTWSKKSRALRGLALFVSSVGWRASLGSDGGSD